MAEERALVMAEEMAVEAKVKAAKVVLVLFAASACVS